MATLNRQGEEGSVPNRNDRVLEKSGYWYYTTREGVDIGPFDTATDAEVGVSEFVNFICTSQPRVLDVLKQYRAA